MIRLIIFYTVLLIVSGYAARRGGAPERWMACLYVAAAIASHAIVLLHGSDYAMVDAFRLGVDAALLLGMMAIMARADRFWPIYCTAFQVLAVTTHGVRMFDPLIIPSVYYRSTAWLAYPTQFLLFTGILRHHRRTASGVEEADWTYQRHALQIADRG